MPGSPPWRRAAKGAVVAGAVTAGTLLLTSGAAWAEQSVPPDTTTVEGLGIATNILWVVIGAVLVIFMQAGFALVETGFCRAKHAAHVVSTNFAIFGLGLRRLLPGRLRVHVRRLRHVVARLRGAWEGSDRLGELDVPVEGRRPLSAVAAMRTPPALMAFFLYMVAFMDTTATIPTGAMAERWKWKAFVGWGLFCGAIYYPLFGAWTWGGGWLASLGKSVNAGFGYVDFAGSGVVHAMGGAAALAGAIVLGPRIGKYGKDGKPRTLAGPPHPDGHAGHVHPAVRLVRLQRRFHAGRHRHPVRRDRHQHRHRRRLRRHRCHVLGDAAGRQARSRA